MAYPQEVLKAVAIDTMHHISQLNLPDSKHGGGRISSPKLRDTLASCEDFTGLEEGVNRYDLLLLVLVYLLDYNLTNH